MIIFNSPLEQTPCVDTPWDGSTAEPPPPSPLPRDPILRCGPPSNFLAWVMLHILFYIFRIFEGEFIMGEEYYQRTFKNTLKEFSTSKNIWLGICNLKSLKIMQNIVHVSVPIDLL
jgi:hypothetical protein